MLTIRVCGQGPSDFCFPGEDVCGNNNALFVGGSGDAIVMIIRLSRRLCVGDRQNRGPGRREPGGPGEARAVVTRRVMWDVSGQLCRALIRFGRVHRSAKRGRRSYCKKLRVRVECVNRCVVAGSMLCPAGRGVVEAIIIVRVDGTPFPVLVLFLIWDLCGLDPRWAKRENPVCRMRCDLGRSRVGLWAFDRGTDGARWVRQGGPGCPLFVLLSVRRLVGRMAERGPGLSFLAPCPWFREQLEP